MTVTQSPAKASARSRLVKAPGMQQSWTAIVFAVIFVGLAIWLGTPLMNASSRVLDLHQAVPILILALSAVVTLTAGHFDLSVTGIATLSIYLTIGLTVREQWPIGVAILVALGAGLLAGLINGVLIEVVRIHAFIATLATGAVYAGISAVYSNGQQISPTTGTGQLPDWFSGITSISSFTVKAPAVLVILALAIAVVWAFFQAVRFVPARFSGPVWRNIVAAGFVVILSALFAIGFWDFLSNVSVLIFGFFVLAAILWVMMRYTTFGRHLKAVGANPEAARLAGVSNRAIGMSAYLLSGLLASIAGIVMAGYAGSAAPEGAATFLLPAFSAAFLSTVLFSPGQFTVWGAVIGGTVLVWITQALSIGGLVYTWASVINGVILVSAVAVSSIARRR